MACLRMGILVSRRFANAVKRNRTKRIIREAFRHALRTLDVKDDAGYDLVFIPRKKILTAKTGDLIPEMERSLKKALS